MSRSSKGLLIAVQQTSEGGPKARLDKTGKLLRAIAAYRLRYNLRHLHQHISPESCSQYRKLGCHIPVVIFPSFFIYGILDRA